MRYLNIFFAIFCFAMGSVNSGCAVNPVTGKTELAFYRMSESEEIKIGREAFPKAVQQMRGEYQDPALKEYVARVGLSLAHVSQRPDLPYTFKVVNDSSPNAFALPGGHIAITRGLLIGLQNESQIAAVLGHEIGHVTARHAVQGIQRNILLNLGLTVLSSATGDTSYSAVSRQAGQIAGAIIDSSYSRDQESESDRLGIDYMVRARYNPQGAVQLQEYFLKKSEGERDPQWIEGLFRTHPFSKDRLFANQGYIRKRYPYALNNPDYRIGQQAFLDATKNLRATRQGYELYDKGRTLEQQNNLEEAIKSYNAALKKSPEEAIIHTALGVALIVKEDFGRARVHLDRAITLDNNYYESHLASGYLFLKEEKHHEAVRELKQSMELLPTLKGAFFLAEGHEKVGDMGRALELYRQVADADPQGRYGRAADARLRALGGGLQ